MIKRLYLLMTVLLVAVLNADAQKPKTKSQVFKSLDSFHDAVAGRDVEKAKGLLATDVHILEGGSVENRDDYLGHHFFSDSKFLSAMKAKPLSRKAEIVGNFAWVYTRKQLKGTYKGKEIKLISLETAVLQKVEDQWMIKILHWSSGSG